MLEQPPMFPKQVFLVSYFSVGANLMSNTRPEKEVIVARMYINCTRVVPDALGFFTVAQMPLPTLYVQSRARDRVSFARSLMAGVP